MFGKTDEKPQASGDAPEVSTEKPVEKPSARPPIAPPFHASAPPRPEAKHEPAPQAKPEPAPEKAPVFVVAPGHTVHGRAGAKNEGDVIEPRELSGGLKHMLELADSGAVLKQ